MEHTAPGWSHLPSCRWTSHLESIPSVFPPTLYEVSPCIYHLPAVSNSPDAERVKKGTFNIVSFEKSTLNVGISSPGVNVTPNREARRMTVRAFQIQIFWNALVVYMIFPVWNRLPTENWRYELFFYRFPIWLFYFYHLKSKMLIDGILIKYVSLSPFCLLYWWRRLPF